MSGRKKNIFQQSALNFQFFKKVLLTETHQINFFGGCHPHRGIQRVSDICLLVRLRNSPLYANPLSPSGRDKVNQGLQTSQVIAHQDRAYPGFSNMNRIGVFLLR